MRKLIFLALLIIGCSQVQETESSPQKISGGCGLSQGDYAVAPETANFFGLSLQLELVRNVYYFVNQSYSSEIRHELKIENQTYFIDLLGADWDIPYGCFSPIPYTRGVAVCP